jgi:hypothetical protein
MVMIMLYLLLVMFAVIKYFVILEIPVLFPKLCSKLWHPSQPGEHWEHAKESGTNAAIVLQIVG